MATIARRKPVKLRQFVIRLEQPGIYDKLRDEAYKRSKREGRRVPMTELTRLALIDYLAKPQEPASE
jgi:hypothetical protein